MRCQQRTTSSSRKPSRDIELLRVVAVTALRVSKMPKTQIILRICSRAFFKDIADIFGIGIGHPELVPHVILYDANFCLDTPPHLWLSTGFRAMDHSIELMYHPTASEVPTRQMALSAAGSLFKYLPKYKQNPKDFDVITQLQLAAFASLGLYGTNMKGGLGLSHTLGYALGSPYSIPHGVTSCLTLGHVVKLKAENPEDAAQLARFLPFFGQSRSGDDKTDAVKVSSPALRENRSRSHRRVIQISLRESKC